MAKIINILEEKLIHRDPDADEPSWRTRVKRRENDILFLAWIKNASVLELQERVLQEKGWKLISIQRMIRKHEK